MKTCAICKELKPFDCFYKWKGPQSYGPYCKPCHNKRMMAYREANEAKWKAYQSEYKKTYRVENREDIYQYTAEYYAKRRKEDPEFRRRCNKATESKKRGCIKAKARRKLREAVKSGKITREPCCKCGATDRIHGHHEDYTKPLEVMWLCAPCHTIQHGGKVRTMRQVAQATPGN